MALKSVVPLTPYLTLISDTSVLDKRTGNIYEINDLNVESEIRNYYLNNYKVALDVPSDVQFVTSVESKVIEFFHKTADAKISSTNGFLVQVFESGSDGKATRLYYEKIQDPLDENNTLNDSFSNYFILEVDID